MSCRGKSTKWWTDISQGQDRHYGTGRIQGGEEQGGVGENREGLTGRKGRVGEEGVLQWSSPL